MSKPVHIATLGASGVQVMLDRDLASLYGVLTKNLNKAVKRNMERFPEDFMFRLTKEECLRFQSGTLKLGQGKHFKYQPYAFTENGVAMLSSVLHSDRAIEVNIKIMCEFVAMRKTLAALAPMFARIEANERRQIADQSIDEMANELARGAVKSMHKAGRLATQGRSLAKLMDRIMPDEKVDEWGWNLSRKERAAIKKRAAERRAANEARKAEARARAAYRRRIRRFEENGVIEGFAQMNWAFMEAREELKRRGFSFRRMNAMKRAVMARISKWNRQHHRDYVEYFVYQYYKGCEQLYVESLPRAKRAEAKKEWAHALEPFKRPEPWLCPSISPCPAGREG